MAQQKVDKVSWKAILFLKNNKRIFFGRNLNIIWQSLTFDIKSEFLGLWKYMVFALIYFHLHPFSSTFFFHFLIFCLFTETEFWTAARLVWSNNSWIETEKQICEHHRMWERIFNEEALLAIIFSNILKTLKWYWRAIKWRCFSS